VIQESEERLQGFLDSAHDLIQSVDPQGNFMYVNRAWQDVLGYTDEEVESLTFFQILAPNCRERCKKDFARILSGEKVQVLEVDFVAADGRVVQCSGSADVWSKDGEVVATRSIFRDITEQLQARRKLEAFQANLRALVENTGDAIWSVDRDMRLITFNTAFSMSMEVRTNREPIVGDRPADCLPPIDVPWYEEMYERALTGETFSELRDEEIGGQVRSFEFFFNPIREAAGITGVAAFGQDVTARRRTQTALHMAKEQAEQANLAKSQFLASMSHELRTPLNSVIGFTNILLKNRSGKLADQELGFLDRINANGRHLLELINEVLDLAKIEAGKMELVEEAVDLPALIRETLAQLEGQVKGKAVTLRGEIPDGVGTIATDAGKLKQVIINLVGNALKFTKEGQVTVELAVQEDGITPWSIAVKDTGIGIPPDRLKAIFEAFQQADGSTSREFGGTGLGLTISRSLCQLMGFDLMVESQAGRGSTFTILLSEAASLEKKAEQQLMEEALREFKASPDLQDIPVVIASVVAGDQDRGSLLGAVDLLNKPIDPKELLRVLRRNLREPRERQVLVVEDDPVTQKVFRKNLVDAGLEVRLAGNGKEAEEVMGGFTPDLILLDLMMPVMDGTAFLQRLRENPDHVDIPVVICTAKDLSEEEREQLQAEATELLEKGEGFESKLQAVLAHQFPQGPTADQAAPSDGDPDGEGHGDQG
jgi:PAS domain S-box-containing protein